MVTVWVDKLLGRHQVGSIAFKRTTSSEVECFGWVSVKIVIIICEVGNLLLNTFVICMVKKTHIYLQDSFVRIYIWNAV